MPTDTNAGQQSRARSVLLLIVLLGTALVTSIASRREMWLDESHTWLLSGMSLRDLWTFVTGDVHPPVYFLLMNGWRRLAGDDDLVLRIPSILAYVASVVVFAQILQRTGGSRVGRISAACLFAFSPAVVFYGTEVRMYALAVLWACAVIGFWTRLMKVPTLPSRSGQAQVITLSASAVLLMLTHYTGLFFLSGLGIAWLLRCVTGKATWRPFLSFTVLAGLGVGLWAPTIMSQRAGKAEVAQLSASATIATAPAASDDGVAPPKTDVRSGRLWFVSWAKEVAVNLASIAGVYPSSARALFIALAIPFIVLGIGVVLAIWERDDLALSMLIIVTATVLGTLFVSVSRRYLLVMTPAMVLLAWRGLECLRRRYPSLVVAGPLACMVALAGCIKLARSPEPRPLSSIAAVLSADSAGRPVILLSNHGEILLRYYLRRRSPAPKVVAFPVGIDRWWTTQSFKGWANVPVSRDSTDLWADGLDFEKGWLLEYEVAHQDPWGLFGSSLGRRYTRTEVLVSELQASGWRLFQLARRNNGTRTD